MSSLNNGISFPTALSSNAQPLQSGLPLSIETLLIPNTGSSMPLAANGLTDRVTVPSAEASSAAVVPYSFEAKKPELKHLSDVLTQFSKLLIDCINESMLAPQIAQMTSSADVLGSQLTTFIHFINDLALRGKKLPDNFIQLLIKYPLHVPLPHELKEILQILTRTENKEASDNLLNDLERTIPNRLKTLSLPDGQTLDPYMYYISARLFEKDSANGPPGPPIGNLKPDILKKVYEECMKFLSEEHEKELGKTTTTNLEKYLNPALQAFVKDKLPLIFGKIKNTLIDLLDHLNEGKFPQDFDGLIEKLSLTAKLISLINQRTRKLVLALEKDEECPVLVQSLQLNSELEADESMDEVYPHSFSHPEELQYEISQQSMFPFSVDAAIAKYKSVCEEVTRDLIERPPGKAVDDFKHYQKHIREKFCREIAQKILNLLVKDGFENLLDEMKLFEFIKEKLAKARNSLKPFLNLQLLHDIQKKEAQLLDKVKGEDDKSTLNPVQKWLAKSIETKTLKALTSALESSFDILKPDSFNALLGTTILPKIYETVTKLAVQNIFLRAFQKEGRYTEAVSNTVNAIPGGKLVTGSVFLMARVVSLIPGTTAVAKAFDRYQASVSPLFVELIYATLGNVPTEKLNEIKMELFESAAEQFSVFETIEDFSKYIDPILEKVVKTLSSDEELKADILQVHPSQQTEELYSKVKTKILAIFAGKSEKEQNKLYTELIQNILLAIEFQKIGSNESASSSTDNDSGWFSVDTVLSNGWVQNYISGFIVPALNDVRANPMQLIDQIVTSLDGTLNNKEKLKGMLTSSGATLSSLSAKKTSLNTKLEDLKKREGQKEAVLQTEIELLEVQSQISELEDKEDDLQKKLEDDKQKVKQEIVRVATIVHEFVNFMAGKMVTSSILGKDPACLVESITRIQQRILSKEFIIDNIMVVATQTLLGVLEDSSRAIKTV